MEPLLQSEIAKLMGCSITKLHFLLKEAMSNLVSDENLKTLQDLDDLTEQDPTEDMMFSGSLNDVDDSGEEEDDE